MADNGDNVAGDFKFDWRDESAVSPVKKQEGDVCWAFVTIAAIESAHFLATGREKMITLSEQYLIDCDTLNKGYKAGQVSKALKFICDNGGGLYSDSDYPFAAEKRTCECQKHKIVARIHGHKKVTPRDDEEALREAVQIQPVITSIDIRHLKVSKKGIYMYDPLFRVEDVPVPVELLPPNIDLTQPILHGLLIVGFGREDGVEFWTCKNSAGPRFGEDGYIRIQRNVPGHRDAFRIAKRCFYPVIEGFNNVK